MAILKCKMCGGQLDLVGDETVVTCDYCGSKQTVPTADNEKKMNLFVRANRLRSACEFDKAAGVYESIVSEFQEEAEAYWGLVLCKYGIEYVDDPATGKKIPTCHRSSFDSVMEDPNFEMTLEYADSVARSVYREEAKAFERIRTGIIEVSSKEEPYDIFICYKETDENGNRTLDSVLAQDVYDALTNKGYKVFFSRITLEDKLGVEYEPYIFAALNSSKIMLVFGTDYEYFNAVWVKNEWSRFLSLIAKGEKKTLIPCYKDIDAYDMPNEFKRLQAQDLGKLGAVQDLLRGIEKLLPLRKSQEVKETAIIQQVNGNLTSASLLKRVFMFLEDKDWVSANEYCEKVLDIDPENAQAYLGKLMAELNVQKIEQLKECTQLFSDNSNYKKVIRFGNEQLKTLLAESIHYINERNETQRKEKIYNEAKTNMKVNYESYLYKAEDLFRTIIDYKDSAALIVECQNRVKEITYQEAKKRMAKQDTRLYYEASELFKSISDYKDSKELYVKCLELVDETERVMNRVKVLLDELKAIKHNNSSAEEQKKQIELEVSKLLKEKSLLKESLDNFESFTNEIEKLEKESISLKAKKEHLNLQISKLGIFSGKQKRILENDISVINETLKKLDNRLNEYYKQRRFSSKLDIENALIKVDDSIKTYESKYVEARMMENRYDEIIEELKKTDYGRKKLELLQKEQLNEFDKQKKLQELKNQLEKQSQLSIERKQKSIQELKNRCAIGKTVIFGTYKKTDLCWKVIDIKKGKALILCTSVIDNLKFNDKYGYMTWEQCTLRKWLNHDFLTTAFTAKERNMIIQSPIFVSMNPNYSTPQGKPTMDRVFILSAYEVYGYAKKDSELFTLRESWWLRTIGRHEFYAAYVEENIQRKVEPVNLFGRYVDQTCGVRPAMWIDLSH